MKRLVLVLTLLALVACEKTPPAPVFQNTDITGASWGREFALTDQFGKPRTLADFRGKVVALFFGYAQCPDVCPTTLADLDAALKTLGAQAKDVQVLFVTLDPERDTQALLKSYMAQFNPSFLALYGNLTATDRTAREFKIHYAKNPGKNGRYTLDHSASTFVFDRAGRIRLLVPYGTRPQVIAEDLQTLIKLP